jgi:hypothetical protein
MNSAITPSLLAFAIARGTCFIGECISIDPPVHGGWNESLASALLSFNGEKYLLNYLEVRVAKASKFEKKLSC